MHWQQLRSDVQRIALPWLLLVAGAAFAAAQQPALVEFHQGDRMANGLRLVSEPHRTVLLGRDGWLYDSAGMIPLNGIQRVDGRFTVVSSLELRSRLQAEFGRDFEVVSTEHYLVVQPRGRGDRWPSCFERMYRRFVSYMKGRRVVIRDGRFPLVAVVLPDEPSMRAAFAKLRIDAGRVAGVYDLSSNRVLLHDRGNVQGISETVRHEAAHQTAYNTGVHSRVSNTPRWIVEGVGSLFEPAVMEDIRHGTLGDRVNQVLLRQIQMRYAATNSLTSDVQRLVIGDGMFENPEEVPAAYAVGWAMTFYLAERQPRQFAALLHHTNRLPPFEKYDRVQRLQDFETIVGTDIYSFAKRLERFLGGL